MASENAPRDENFVPAALFEISGSPGQVKPGQIDQSTGRILVNSASGSGSVTSVSVVTANGFAGTVATPSTTPAITMETTVTGVLKGNGTAISAATGGTDYTNLAFKQVAVSGQTNVVAGNAEDTLTLAAGSNVTLTTTPATNTVTIAASSTSTPPGGSTTQLQYNNAGAFGGITGVTTNGTNLTIASGNLVFSGSTSGSTILNPSATASGTLTLPAATDTLVGKATTDTLTNKTLDTAGIGNVLKINGTQVSAVTGTGSVVLATSPTLVAPTLGAAIATSLQANTLSATANNSINVNAGSYNTIQTYTPAAAGTATLDLSKGNVHHITMPAGNITIALSNATAGQCFIVRILQDATGSRTVTWFTTIKWAGGLAPTLTTTANKADTMGFEVTGVGAYDGFIVGQNI